MKKIICLYGLPACGKTTQANKLIEEYAYSYFGMGERLRAEVASDSSLGQKIKSYVEGGTLIPDDCMIEVIKNVGPEIKKNGIIFDGFPRMISQAYMLEDIIKEIDMKVDAFICLNVSPEEALRRIEERSKTNDRHDDKDANAIKNRMDVFKQESIVLMDYYRQQNKLIEINGEMSIEDVYSKIKEELERLENI
ncbi:MAG TPA: nucleoside monophosphate kinase [bacterium]|nr:nucleoside monophosphate kinase [bacterium]